MSNSTLRRGQNAALWLLFLVEIWTLSVMILSLIPFAISYWITVKFISNIHQRMTSSREPQGLPISAAPKTERYLRAASHVRILRSLKPTEIATGSAVQDTEHRGGEQLPPLNDPYSDFRLICPDFEPNIESEKDIGTISSGTMEIKTRLVSLDDNELPKYLALFYVPEDVRKTACVSIAGVPLTISSSLMEALRVVQAAFGGPEKRGMYVWTRELCVSRLEANVMGSDDQAFSRNDHIHRRATKLVIWLGRAENQARCLFAFIRVWSNCLMEWEEWKGSLKPEPSLLRKLSEVITTAWKTWDEPLISTSSSFRGPGGSENDSDGGARSTETQEQTTVTELNPAKALLDVFHDRPYWNRIEEFQHSCSPTETLLLCDYDIVVGLHEVSRVFLWMVNFGTELVQKQRPSEILPDVWDVLLALIPQISQLPIFELLIEEKDKE
ncbi:hypothetical protein F4782DRAFT_513240 [Xylaria castorea]|nr:hypothetical protein F4782DRAFT_513240 [Xylaria castorea]